jgi:hypothetical protein
MEISRAQAVLELELLEIDAEGVETGELYASLRDLKLPREVAVRLEALAEISGKISGKAIAVGKIIVLKQLEFIRQHPYMAVGMALGATVSVLSNAIPLLGSLLAPVALVLGVAIGGIAGHWLDEGMRDTSANPIIIAQDVLEIAKDFFALLIALFGAVLGELTAESAA